MQTDGRLAYHPIFQHCTSQYVDDYDTNHHIKACLSSEEVMYLWSTDVIALIVPFWHMGF